MALVSGLVGEMDSNTQEASQYSSVGNPRVRCVQLVPVCVLLHRATDLVFTLHHRTNLRMTQNVPGYQLFVAAYFCSALVFSNDFARSGRCSDSVSVFSGILVRPCARVRLYTSLSYDTPCYNVAMPTYVIYVMVFSLQGCWLKSW